MRFYIGAYTNKGAHGIYQCDFDPATGLLGKLDLAAKSQNPSFLTLHPTLPVLYAVNEDKSGHVSAFSIDAPTGYLHLLNQEFTHGSSPCHVSIDPAGRCAMVANYSSGNVASFPLGADGRLDHAATVDQHHGHGPDPKRQQGPHAHCIQPDPGGKFAFSCDLGLDQILIYQIDAVAGKIIPHDPPFASTPPGQGPRHIKFHPKYPVADVVTEMGNTLCVFHYESAAGKLTPVQVLSTLPPHFSGANHAAEVQFHPSGNFLYVSNRGDDSITVFSIAFDTGEVKYLCRQSVGGKNPRHFTVDPTGKYLVIANQDSNNITVMKIISDGGELAAPLAQIEVPAPVCVTFAK